VSLCYITNRLHNWIAGDFNMRQESAHAKGGIQAFLYTVMLQTYTLASSWCSINLPTFVLAQLRAALEPLEIHFLVDFNHLHRTMIIVDVKSASNPSKWTL